jgi:ABC-type uncharacterized transport system substrate-binding protein
MLKLQPIKRGDTFAFYADFVDENSAPITGVEAYLQCQSRDANDTLKTIFTVSATDVAGKYLFTSSDTSLLTPDETIYIDIQFSKDGTTTSSETFSVLVKGDVTHG